MRLEFLATMDDLIDVQIGVLDRSRQSTHWRWAGGVVTGFLIGALLLISMPVALPWRLATSLAATLAIVALFRCIYPWLIRKSYRRYFRETMRIEAPFKVEVELTPQSFKVRMLGTEIAYEWSEIEGFREREDSVDVLTRRGSLIAVRKRGFSSDQDLQSFRDALGRLINPNDSNC